jgi:hypothetical protein
MDPADNVTKAAMLLRLALNHIRHRRRDAEHMIREALDLLEGDGLEVDG